MFLKNWQSGRLIFRIRLKPFMLLSGYRFVFLFYALVCLWARVGPRVCTFVFYFVYLSYMYIQCRFLFFLDSTLFGNWLPGPLIFWFRTRPLSLLSIYLHDFVCVCACASVRVLLFISSEFLYMCTYFVICIHFHFLSPNSALNITMHRSIYWVPLPIVRCS